MSVSKANIKLVRSLQQKKFRDERGLFVAEGRKCVEELAKAFEQVMLFVEGENATAQEIEQMSSLRTPQGVIGVFRKREIGDSTSFGLVVALDGVQDPGNLGTIIRTCDWFGVRRLVCSHDTADCYNPKVVQATMGALARVQVEYVDLVSWLEEIKALNSPYLRYIAQRQEPIRRRGDSRSAAGGDYHGQRRQWHIGGCAAIYHPSVADSTLPR